ncbi:MAG: hypothetical protein D6788_01625 [Planctomycetota bacterium]|nr:MAG: hypothetical protein D6788_01625 [Planctomycetota bacterium]
MKKERVHPLREKRIGSRSALFMGLVLGYLMITDQRAEAQPCSDPNVTCLYATNVNSSCAWYKASFAEGDPGGATHDCDQNLNMADYAIQDTDAIASGFDACSKTRTDFGCTNTQCPEFPNEGDVCKCWLKASAFTPYTLPPGKAIRQVKVDVQCRYNHGPGNPGSGSGDSGRIKVRVRLPATRGTETTLTSQVFVNNDDDGLCKYRLKSNNSDDVTNDVSLGVFQGNWTASLINDLRVWVRRVKDNDGTNSALRVSAIRIKVIHCDDPNGNGSCCGNGVVDPGEQCDGGACCTSTCQFVGAGAVCRGAAGPCDVPETCTGSSPDCPPDGFAGDGTPCDDGLFCTVGETCSSGSCTGGSARDCSDATGCTVDTCNEVADVCDHVPDNAACSDGLFCNGVETCDPVNDCQPGSTPCQAGQFCDETADACVGCLTDADCDDGLFCNGTETCNPITRTCQSSGNPCSGDTPVCFEDTDTCGMQGGPGLPAVSTWGLVVLGVVLLIGLKIYFGRENPETMS